LIEIPSRKNPEFKTMKLPRVFQISKALCLVAAVGFPWSPLPATTEMPQAPVPEETLLANLEAALGANPAAKGYAETLQAASASAATQGDFQNLERILIQMKSSLGSNPQAVSIIDELLARYRAAEDAARAKRSKEVASLVTDLVAKFNARAPAKDFDELIKRASDLMGGGQNAYRDPAGSETLQEVSQFAAEWQDYLIQSQLGRPQPAAEAMRQLVQLSVRFTAIPRSTLVGIQNTPVADSGAGGDEQERAKFDQIVVRVVAAIDAAKVPADLDPILGEIGPARLNFGQNPQAYAAAQRFENVKTFVRKWQDYLNAVQQGKAPEAHRLLTELASPNYDASFYPRSRILARMSESVKAPDSPARSNLLMDPDSLTMDNLRVLESQIDALNDPKYMTDHNEGFLRNAISRIGSVRDQVKAGDLRTGVSALQNIGMMGIGSSQTGDYSNALRSLNEQLVKESLPPYLGVPADLKPDAKESIPDYMERVIEHAISAKDWPLAYRAVQARRDIGPIAGSPEEITADINGFRAMIAAMDKEEASQWAESVSSYMEALNSTGRHLPVKEIGERLARIQREHPAEFEKGKSMPDYPSMINRLLDSRINAPQDPRIQRPRPGTPGFPNAGINPQAPPGGLPTGVAPPPQEAPKSSPSNL
jgi:hypothetical protein